MIYQLKITLKGSKPPIWRRIQVDPGISFHQLHRIIQICMNWSDTHLHEFICHVPEEKREEMGELFKRGEEEGGSLWSFLNLGVLDHGKARIGDRDENDEVFRPDIIWDEYEQKLDEWLLQEKDKCSYTYDFGDDWQHEILLEKIVQIDETVTYPLCVKARKEAPMEDRGGIWDYEEEEVGRADKEIAQDINDIFLRLAEELKPDTDGFQLEPDGPTLEEWGRLYRLAIEWKELKSWKWMNDDHLFGVIDTERGHTGYCCVMGQGGEMFGLAVYVDEEGLTSLLKTIGRDLEEWEEDDYYDIRSLLFILEDREELDKEDLELIQELNPSLPGRRHWPMFRSQSPGLYPWRLNRDEVLFFTRVLEQALIVCERAKEQQDLLLPKRENEIFARQWNHSSWEDVSLSLVPQRKEKSLPILPVNELKLQRTKKTHQMVPAVFEFDFMYSPDPIRERRGDRPFYPYLGLWVDYEEGFVLDFAILSRGGHEVAFQEKTLQLFDKVKAIPREIRVKKQEAYAILAPLARKLGIELKVVYELPMLQEAADEMKSQFVF